MDIIILNNSKLELIIIFIISAGSDLGGFDDMRRSHRQGEIVG